MKIRKRIRPAILFAMFALVFAIAGLFFLTFSKAYSTTQVQTAVSPGGTSTEQTVETFHQSIIEVNGLGVLWLLILPVVPSAVGLWASFRQTKSGKITLWASAVVLFLFSFVTGFSIGMLYMPAAILLIAAAAIHTFSLRKEGQVRHDVSI